MTSVSRNEIQSWPKAELHCHLDGSLRVETLVELAKEQGKSGLLPSTSIEKLKEILREIDGSGNLEAYLRWFRYSIPVMQDQKSLRRVAYELAHDASLENIRYIEVRYSPVEHTKGTLSIEEVNSAVLEGLSAASSDFGIRTGLIVCGLRDRFESDSLRMAELAVAFRDRGVVGFDLAGSEAGNPPKLHLPAFYYAANHLLNITIHAGEAWGPDSIHQALFRCHAHRIGHGTSLFQDVGLMRYVVDHQIPLEICPTSNVQTGVVSSYENHPVSEYVNADVAVTINTDNRLFSRTTLTDELLHVHQRCGVSRKELRRIVLNGFRHAFLPWDERKDLVRNIEAEFKTLHAPNPDNNAD